MKEKTMTITKKDIWTVHLTTVGNPDFGQFSPITDPEDMSAESLPELRDQIKEWQNYWSVGGGNWTEPMIRKNGKPVGYMSYNCRLWKLESREMTHEEQRRKYGSYFPKELEIVGDDPSASEAPLKRKAYHVAIPYYYHFYVIATTEQEAIQKAHDSEGKMGEYDETNILIEEISDKQYLGGTFESTKDKN